MKGTYGSISYVGVADVFRTVVLWRLDLADRCDPDVVLAVRLITLSHWSLDCVLILRSFEHGLSLLVLRLKHAHLSGWVLKNLLGVLHVELTRVLAACHAFGVLGKRSILPLILLSSYHR
jgi:hypothetical protein